MVSAKSRSSEPEPSLPQLAPSGLAMGGTDLTGFIWQQLRELQSSAGAVQEAQARLAITLDRMDDKLSAQLEGLKTDVIEVKSEIKSMKSSLDSTKSKVDDLANWKHKIIGGAIALGIVGTLIGFAISKAGEYITIKAPAAVAAPAK